MWLDLCLEEINPRSVYGPDMVTPLARRVGPPLFTPANPYVLYCVSYCNCRSTFQRETKLFDHARSGNLVI